MPLQSVGFPLRSWTHSSDIWLGFRELIGSGAKGTRSSLHDAHDFAFNLQEYSLTLSMKASQQYS